MRFENTLEFAKRLDVEDPLSHFRNEFYIPVLNKKEVIYFSGNSLGLQPKGVQDAVLDELEDWASFGIEGYNGSRNPWMTFHKRFPELLSEITGAQPEEIVVMNQLTTNLHLMMESFYRPEGKRKKILFEAKAFSSDEYAIKSQMTLNGIDPATDLIEIRPRKGEFTIRNEDIIQAIKDTGDELALVLIGGVNYYTGQVFFMKAITKAAHEVGAFCGFDLAHGVGNIELKLHEWEVDFACWCSYKYLNSGPGGVGGVFIHKKHVGNKSLPRLQGWWGANEEKRFEMQKDFDPIPTAEGWQLSIAPVLSMAVHQVSLELFKKAGFRNVLAKGADLSAYLLFLLGEIIDHCPQKPFDIITPLEPSQHGCQVSLLMGANGKHQFDMLRMNGVIAAWREPNVIRIAPVPLYNTYEDVFMFAKILEHAVLKG